MSQGPHSRMFRRSVGVLALFLVAALLLPFVHIRWFHASIVDSISNALNRPVTVEAVSLRLLPQPGFDLHKFVVADDPSFSAEPMLRADDVTAYLRFSSLWRARPEIARLSLSGRHRRQSQGRCRRGRHPSAVLGHGFPLESCGRRAAGPKCSCAFPTGR